MDFYAPDVKWIRNQKNIETKLFNELIVSHTKKYDHQGKGWVVHCHDCPNCDNCKYCDDSDDSDNCDNIYNCDNCDNCDNCEDIDLISSNNIHELFKVRGREYYYIYLKGSDVHMFRGEDKHNPVIAHISPYLYRTLNV